MIPTDLAIEELHRKYAKNENEFNLIYTHCQVVEAIAMQLLDTNSVRDIDRQLVHVGCLLHDIGAYDVLEDGRFVKGVRHGTIGEEILKKEGFSETIWRFASHHTGVGLTEQDVINQAIPIPVADYTARTDEERLIMYADKFHSKSHPPDEPPHFCSFEWFRASIQQHGAGKADKFDALAELFGRPNLDHLSKQFGYGIKDV